MENKKHTTKKNLINESSYEKLLKIYNQLFGEYKHSSKTQDKPTSNETDIDEGKLFTKFIMKK
jgi:hypothetical protein